MSKPKISKIQNFYAVLMGDLVHSTEHKRPQALHGIFNQAILEANVTFQAVIASPLTITLGDEFQGVLTSLSSAFEVMHFIRMQLLESGVDVRFVLGTADIQTPINPLVAWNMMGKGFAEAREGLSDKRDLNFYRFSLPECPIYENLLSAVGLSVTMIEYGWTPTQFKYVKEVLRRPDLSKMEIAKKLKVSQNNLFKTLRSARYNFYSHQIEVIQQTLKSLDKELGIGR